MAKSLPAQPNLDWLKKAAKERLTELRSHDPSTKLHDAQLDVAKDYGFKSWRALKAYIDSVSVDGQIITATVRGDARKLAQLLTEHPAKVRITGSQLNRPLLHLAAEGGHLGCIKLLLGRGADVNERDRLDHASALHWAAQEGHLEAVKLLAEAGSDIDGSGDEHGLGVMGWATCFRTVQGDVAEWLLQRGARPTIFSSIALVRDDLVRALVERSPQLLSDRMSRFEHRRTPLHFAVLKNRPDIVELLLRMGADHTVKDDRGDTPLNCASSRTHKRVVDLLIAAGANPKEQSLNRFGSAVPILSVKNVSASIAYYVEKLGFLKEWDWGTPPTFGCVHRDQVRIFLCQGAQGAPGTWLSIFVHDVDALHEDYQRRGAIIRQPPTNFPWGLREMNVEDPDGHRLRIGSDATGSDDGTMLNEAP